MKASIVSFEKVNSFFVSVEIFPERAWKRIVQISQSLLLDKTELDTNMMLFPEIFPFNLWSFSGHQSLKG